MQDLPSGAGKKQDQIMTPTGFTLLLKCGREVMKGKTERPWKESQDLRCLSPPVRGSLLWQARKYFSNLSPCWHRRVIDTNMPTPLKSPLCSTFTTLLFFWNTLGRMELIDSGESGGRKWRERRMRPLGFGDAPGSGKFALFCLLIFVWRAQFPGSKEVKHTVWHRPLTSD